MLEQFGIGVEWLPCKLPPSHPPPPPVIYPQRVSFNPSPAKFWVSEPDRVPAVPPKPSKIISDPVKRIPRGLLRNHWDDQYDKWRYHAAWLDHLYDAEDYWSAYEVSVSVWYRKQYPRRKLTPAERTERRRQRRMHLERKRRIRRLWKTELRLRRMLFRSRLLFIRRPDWFAQHYYGEDTGSWHNAVRAVEESPA